MQNQINLQRGDAVFYEGMYYYYPLGHPVNAIQSAQSLGPAYRQHQTKTLVTQASRLIRNQVQLPSRTIPSMMPTVPFYWVDPLKTNVGKLTLHNIN